MRILLLLVLLTVACVEGPPHRSVKEDPPAPQTEVTQTPIPSGFVTGLGDPSNFSTSEAKR